MKKLLILSIASLSLFACASLPDAVPKSPAAVAEVTTLDERLILGAEVSYKAARSLGEAAVDTGQVTPAAAVTIKSVDIALFGVLLKARHAYDTANAASYEAALAEAAPLLNRFWSLVRPKRREGEVP